MEQTLQNNPTASGTEFQSCADALFKDAKKLEAEKLTEMKQHIHLPPNRHSKIEKWIEDISKLTAEDFKQLDKETKQIILEYLQTVEASYNEIKTNILATTYSKDGLVKDDPDHFTNIPVVNEKELTIRPLNVKKVNSKSAVLLKLQESLGLGSTVQVPLWHSGFWVTIKPMSNIDKLSLFLEMGKALNRIGANTAGLAFSNLSFLLHKIILEKLRPLIINRSIALKEDEDIYDYIAMEDLDILIWGFLRSLHPRSVQYVLSCKNNMELDENKIPKCNYTSTIKLDLSKLLWVDKSKLSPFHLSHMSKRAPNSVSKEEVKKYREELDINQEETITIPTDEIPATLVIKSPSLSKYIEHGEYFIEILESKATELVEHGIVENKEEAELPILNTIYLTIYSHYVDKMVAGTEVYDSIDAIYDALELFSADEEKRKIIEDTVNKFITDNAIAVVGIPDYTCPICRSSQSTREHGPFRSIISMASLEYFFTLLGANFIR